VLARLSHAAYPQLLTSVTVESFLLNAEQLRARTGAKWRNHPPEVIPAFVADMDFKVAPAIHAAMQTFVDADDYGYGRMDDRTELFNAFAAWMSRRHGWQLDPALTQAIGDVVQGLTAAIVAFSKPGDGVIAQTPVYPPFLKAIASTGRRLVESPLADDGKRFVMDLDDLERAAEQAKVLLLCSPHNPTGRIFESAELEGVARIAAANHLTIVADEIHADLVYSGATHVPMETVTGAADRTVTLTSATKGFNIAGLHCAVTHFGSGELKERYCAVLPEWLLGGPSRQGIAATIAAWRESESWLTEVLQYLNGNRRVVAEWAAENNLGHHPGESTYLAWLDCGRLSLPSGTTPQEHFLERARVALSAGSDFGPPGEGHVRLNYATSAGMLDEILSRLSGAIEQLDRR
jgi:cysteine-S-conjugate beta-lyase